MSLPVNRRIQSSNTQNWVGSESPTKLIIIADCSSSMDGRKIEEVNNGLVDCFEILQSNAAALQLVQLEIIAVGGFARIVFPSQSVLGTLPPQLHADGATPLGEGILLAERCVDEYKEFCVANEVQVRPQLVLVMTDGEPTDSDEIIKQATCATQRMKTDCCIIPLLCTGGNKAALEELCGTSTFPISDVNLRAIFQRAARTVSTVSRKSVTEVSVGMLKRLMLEGED